MSDLHEIRDDSTFFDDALFPDATPGMQASASRTRDDFYTAAEVKSAKEKDQSGCGSDNQNRHLLSAGESSACNRLTVLQAAT